MYLVFKINNVDGKLQEEIYINNIYIYIYIFIFIYKYIAL